MKECFKFKDSTAILSEEQVSTIILKKYDPQLMVYGSLQNKQEIINALQKVNAEVAADLKSKKIDESVLIKEDEGLSTGTLLKNGKVSSVTGQIDYVLSNNNNNSTFNIENWKSNISPTKLQKNIRSRSWFTELVNKNPKISNADYNSFISNPNDPANNSIYLTLLDEYVKHYTNFWNKNATIGSLFHEYAAMYLENNPNPTNLLKISSKLAKEMDISVNDLNVSLIESLEDVKKHVNKKGGLTILTEKYVRYDKPSKIKNQSFPIIGKIDIMTIDNEGNVTIYDFKTMLGNDSEDDIDRNKKIKSHIQLQVYRNMLTQMGFDIKSINVEILPINLGYDVNTNKFSKISYDPSSLGINWNLNGSEISNVSAYSKQIVPYKSNIKINEKNLIDSINSQANQLFGKTESDDINYSDEIEKANPVLDEDYKSKAQNKYRYFNKVRNGYVSFVVDKSIDTVEKVKNTDIWKEQMDHYDIDLKDSIRASTEEAAKIISALILHDYNDPNNPFRGNYEVGYQAYHFVLNKYVNNTDYEVITTPVLNELGMIMIKNTYTDEIDIVSVINKKHNVNIGKRNDNVLSRIRNKGTQIGNLLLSTHSNVAGVKATLALNKLMEDNPEFKKYKLNNVSVLNIIDKTVSYVDMTGMKYSMAAITGHLGIKNNIDGRYTQELRQFSTQLLGLVSKIKNDSSDLSSNLQKEIKSFISKVYNDDNELDWVLLYEKLRSYSTDDTESSLFENSNLSQQIQLLLEFQKTLRKYISTLVNTNASEIVLGTAKRLDNSVISVLLSLTRLTANIDDAYRLPEMWNLKEYQVFNTTDVATADTIDIQIQKNLRNLLSKTEDSFKREYKAYKDVDRFHTNAFYESKGISYAQRNLVNGTIHSFKNLILTNVNGKVNAKMMTKTESDPTLSKAEKEYLTWWLKDLNAARFGKVSANKEAELKSTGEWYLLPLIEGESSSKITYNITSANNVIKKAVKISKDKINRTFNEDQEQLPGHELQKKELKFEDMLSMYNPFDSTEVLNNTSNRRQVRDLMIETQGVEFFEFQLEVLKDKYISHKMKQSIYNNVLPIINGLVKNIKHNAFMSKTDITAIVNYIEDYLKSAVFNQTLVKPEDQKLYKQLSAGKSVASFVILGGNWMGFTKEILTGMWKANQMALANTVSGNNMFSYKDVMKAYRMLSIDAMKQLKNVTLIEQLNEIYGLTNMDSNDYDKQLNRQVGEYSKIIHNNYAGVRVGDYYNRMMILLAQMNHDGCLDAHSLDKNNTLVYDMKKDKRFNLLFGSDKTSKEYKKQLAMYKTVYSQFQSEDTLGKYWNGVTLDVNSASFEFNPKDSNYYLPRAYTLKQRDNIKTFSDTMYGYMDHSDKSLMFKRAMWGLIGQFQTFATAKRNQWLQAPTEHGTRGQFEQVKNTNGELLYWEYNFDELGVSYRVQTTNPLAADNKTNNEPVIDWNSYNIEGYVWTIWKALKAVSTMDREGMAEIWSNPHKRANIVMALQDLMLMAAVMWLFELLFGETRRESYNSDNIGRRIGARLIYNSATDMNIFDTFVNFVSFDAPSFGLITQWGKDFYNAIFNDAPWVKLILPYGGIRIFSKDFIQWEEN